MTGPVFVRLCAAIVSLLILPLPGSGQTADRDKVFENVSEEAMIQALTRLSDPELSKPTQAVPPAIRLERLRRIVALVDALHERSPKSPYRDKAMIHKLTALAELARARPEYLSQLLALTESVSRSDAKGELASESAFFAIQAFVLGARAESMPEERRLLGTLERYEAFLKDYPKSERHPVIWASLIRNLLALSRIESAQSELKKLGQAFPDHRATRRATGEVYRATAVGKPFAFGYVTPEGEPVRSTDYLGKVLLVHFWATWSGRSIAGLDELVELHRKYRSKGLQLIGINVDANGTRTATALKKYKMSWPQYFDDKGLENDILVGAGVVTIPTIFVVDRAGICRSTDPGERLTDLVETLLAETHP